jgi:hypothetical protein
MLMVRPVTVRGVLVWRPPDNSLLPGLTRPFGSDGRAAGPAVRRDET